MPRKNRVRLERKLALLKRDTSGKSDLAIAGAENELRSLNQSAYDQRQDDFVESEEKHYWLHKKSCSYNWKFKLKS